MFAGLCAFPLTPMDERGIDEAAFTRLITRLAEAGVDSVGALGSTGNYAYLTRHERSRVARLAITAADGTPVMVGVGAARTAHVLALAEDAQQVDQRVSVPVCVYDNPDTTHFAFSDELYRDVARLANVHAIKIPAPPIDEAATRIAQLRELIGANAVLGISGDGLAASSLLAGALTWFSVIGGLLPDQALAITTAARAADRQQAIEASDQLSGFWELFETHGSLRVIAAAAARLGVTQEVNLPRPLRPLDPAAQHRLSHVLASLGLEPEGARPCTP
jgi:4-hydroxy-tetrahydrodipicolinate synthase